MTAALQLSEEQILYFRARRGHLAGPGAPNATEAARAMLGAQSQQELPSLWALSLRTQGRPSLTDLRAQLMGEERSLVRTWGQRETIHVYDAKDWSTFLALYAENAAGPRRTQIPTPDELDEILHTLKDIDAPLTRKSIAPLVPERFAKQLEPQATKYKLDLGKLAAGRALFALVGRGDLCIGPKLGAQQSYVVREDWFPTLVWPTPLLSPGDAAIRLFRRYLQTYGAATAADIAHFFGLKRRETKARVEALGQETPLITVHCEGRKDLLALAEDAEDLQVEAPDRRRWPVRLLPLWEGLLMGHADKSFTVPNEKDRPLIWRKAAMVMAVVLDRGRIVAAWTQKKTRKRLDITLEPLSGWRKSQHLKGVEREAAQLATHLDIPDVRVQIAS